MTNAAIVLAKLLNHARGRFPLRRTTLGAGDHGVRTVNSVSLWTRYGKLSNRTFLCSKRCIRGIRLHRLLRKSRATPTSIDNTVITERLRFEPEPVDSEVFDHPGIVVAGDRRL